MGDKGAGRWEDLGHSHGQIQQRDNVGFGRQRVSSLEPMTDNTKVTGQEPKSPARWTKAATAWLAASQRVQPSRVMHTPSQGDVELQAGITPVGL